MALPHPRGKELPEPIIRNFHNIECRDAVLDLGPLRAGGGRSDGKPVTRWDGRTTKPHPVTGEEVPDECENWRSRFAVSFADCKMLVDARETCQAPPLKGLSSRQTNLPTIGCLP